MLVNSYRLIRQIGSGNFSHVFLGEHKKNKEKQVAIKIGQVNEDASIAHESRILRHLNTEMPDSVQDYVPRLIWYGRFGTNQMSMIMTYYPISLASFLDRSTNINRNTNSVYKIISQIISALSYIHCVGVLHRDIKLDNFMIQVNSSRDEFVNTHITIIDFGFACYYENIGKTNGEIGKEEELNNHLIGTPNYTSYFLYEGSRYSKRDDLLSAFYLFMELLGIPWPWNSAEAEEPLCGYPPYHRLSRRNQARAFYKKPVYLMNYLVNYPVLLELCERFYLLDTDENPDYAEYNELIRTQIQDNSDNSDNSDSDESEIDNDTTMDSD